MMRRIDVFLIYLIFTKISSAATYNEEKYVVEGKDIIIACNYDTCLWTNEEGPIFTDNQFEVSINECKLKIKSIPFQMNGWTFICAKSNRESRIILVNVLVTPDVHFEDSKGNRLLGQEIVLSHNAQDIILKCVAKNGFPKAFIQCQEDGDNIASALSEESMNEKRLYDVINSLQIKFENPDQFAKHINCKILHSSFEIPREVFLTIRKEYATSNISLNVTKMEQKYKLTCFADGYPIPDTMIIKKGDPNDYKITNDEISLDEFGTFYCLAKNKLNKYQIKSKEISIKTESIITEEELTTMGTNGENVEGMLSSNSARSTIQINIIVSFVINVFALFIMKNL